MSEWAPDGFSNKAKGANSLKGSIENLSPKAKQAFFAAASHKVIRRGTWNGCAFNAGGLEVGDQTISNTRRAAELFEMDQKDVSTFIRYWDNSHFSSDEEATKTLRTMIEEVGLFTDPVGKTKFAGKTFVKVLHESDLTKMRNEFDSMVENLSLDDAETPPELVEFKEAATEAGELLFC